MAEPRRIQRLEQAILQTVAPIVSHGLSDPRLQLVTVTRVRLSKDLSVARINWSCIGERSARAKASRALEDARGYLQTAVARNLRTRTTPHLEFHYDPGLEKSVRIHQILHDLATERGETEPDEEEADADPDIEAPDDPDQA